MSINLFQDSVTRVYLTKDIDVRKADGWAQKPMHLRKHYTETGANETKITIFQFGIKPSLVRSLTDTPWNWSEYFSPLFASPPTVEISLGVRALVVSGVVKTEYDEICRSIVRYWLKHFEMEHFREIPTGEAPPRQLEASDSL